MRLWPKTITQRLVAISLALVALSTILLGALTTFTMRTYLTDRLDAQLVDIVKTYELAQEREAARELFRPYLDQLRERSGSNDMRSLLGATPTGTVAIDLRSGNAAIVNADNDMGSIQFTGLGRIERLEADGQARTVRIGDLGNYRVMVTRGPQVSEAGLYTEARRAAIGLPMTEVEAASTRLLFTTLALTALGIAVAGVIGAAIMRRQLRPLREVAATAHEVTTQDLGTGAPDLSTRVSTDLVDPETEVGQVGYALNTLLDHVGSALDERHRSEQQVRQFVADASHELRTPLATINGYAQLATKTPDDPAALNSALEKVRTEADRMGSLVADLLLLARLDSGRPLESKEVDLSRMLLEAVDDARVVARGHHWRIDLPAEPLEITGDEMRLHQAITNLLNNARSHTPEGTTVTLAAKVADAPTSAGPRPGGGASEVPGVSIEVADDGPGVDTELAGKVFTRFARGDSSRTRSSGGAGLGLALVQAIAEAHGGKVSLDSQPGATTFTVWLPQMMQVQHVSQSDPPAQT